MLSGFQMFCNLINVLDVGADSSDAVKIKIEILGFLQLRKPRAATELHKLLSPFAPALSGCWERCVGGLFGHAGYTECLRPESPWFKLHHTGEFGNNYDGKLHAKARRLANQVFLETARLRCYAVLKYSGTHDNKQALNTTHYRITWAIR